MKPEQMELRDTMAAWLLDKVNADEVPLADAMVAAAGLVAMMLALFKPEHRERLAATIKETMLDHANHLASTLTPGGPLSPDQQGEKP